MTDSVRRRSQSGQKATPPRRLNEQPAAAAAAAPLYDFTHAFRRSRAWRARVHAKSRKEKNGSKQHSREIMLHQTAMYVCYRVLFYMIIHVGKYKHHESRVPTLYYVLPVDTNCK